MLRAPLRQLLWPVVYCWRRGLLPVPCSPTPATLTCHAATSFGAEGIMHECLPRDEAQADAVADAIL